MARPRIVMKIKWANTDKALRSMLSTRQGDGDYSSLKTQLAQYFHQEALQKNSLTSKDKDCPEKIFATQMTRDEFA